MERLLSGSLLKNIKLEYVVLSDDHFVKLLSGCPALETMEVDMVGGFSRLEISSLKMKRLNLKGLLYFSIGNDHFLEIHAPYLHNLEISGFHQECRLVDVSSVVNAKRSTLDVPKMYMLFLKKISMMRKIVVRIPIKFLGPSSKIIYKS
uniref:F-box/LRR-repeat protein n=1 Tax=Solanum tuberosum TaxID=4113 RepID=M1E129_SOLTU